MVVKRKANARDSPQADEVLLSDGGADLTDESFNGIFSENEEDSGTSGEEHSELEADSENEGTDLTEEDSDEDDEADEDETLSGGKLQQNGTTKQNGVNSDRQLRPHSPEEDAPNYSVVTDANGNERYVYKSIDPIYDSDESDAPATNNTIGNIPLSFYDSYPHIGYDINGKKISRPAKGEALDALLDTIEIPKGWTGLTDPATGKPLELSQEELNVLKRIQMDEVPEEGYDPYPATIEYFTGKTETMPLNAAPEPKRRFVPSKHEAKRVMKIVKAIREGRIQPYRPPAEEEEDEDLKRYDIWANEAPRPDHPMNIAAPKLPPPGYDESYHPPPEYLPDAVEKKAWEEADDEDKKEYLPTSHDALRKVPGYDKFIKEKFERCLDLYLAPRVRRSKLDIDPESLLPKLPNPEDLRPFPITCMTVFRGHEGRVRSVAIDPSGLWLASGGDDGTVRMWNLESGRETWKVKLGSEEAVNVLSWQPGSDALILAVGHGEDLYFVVPGVDQDIEPEIETSSRDILDKGWGYATTNSIDSKSSKKSSAVTWSRPSTRLQEVGVLIKATMRSTIKVISWHRRGDYLATVSPAGQSSSVAIHTLSKHLTQHPFRRLKGIAQTTLFHPTKPLLFVATQRLVRVYDLARQTLHKTLTPGARFISSLDLHPLGDNLLVGSYDRRLLWHDMDLSHQPYKTMRYHAKAIRAVCFHKGGLPLFADASDDGTVQVFHGKVVGDLLENATIVPLKVLRGHAVRKELGVLDIDWHPSHPWLVSAGADGTCRLWS